MTQILVFGDSIAYGAWDTEGGWAQRLRSFLDKKVIDSKYEEYFLVYNLGIDGDTAEGVLKRFELEARPRMWPDEETVFIFSVGGNDSVFVHKTNKTKFSEEQFKANVDKVVKLAKKYSNKIILKGETPVDESKVDPIPWLEGHSCKNSYRKQFDKILKLVAKENNVYFIDLYDKLENAGYKKLLADGDHPTSEGHKLIFEIMKEYLTKNKII
jgi:lysophospholipase L1-like esterase